MTAFWVLITIAAIAAAVAVVLYNGLVKKKNFVEDAWSGIEVQLKKRHNLIPNLVNTVKAYAEHESGLLTSVTELRNLQPKTQGGAAEIGASEQAFSQALSGLMVQVEAYPDLKADHNFRDLQNELSQLENDIESARRYYNGSVREYNTMIQSFPSNLIAGHFDFREAEFFELDVEAARQVPEVNFNQ